MKNALATSRVFSLAVLFLTGLSACQVFADALERLEPARLKAMHAAIEALRSDRQEVAVNSPYQDFRAVLHVHSLLSHDSRSKPAEIRAAAKATGVQIVMFTEHPAPHYDYYRDGHRGLEDGVLFIPGAEKDGLLCFPLESVPADPDPDPQSRLDAVRKTRGQAFLSHLEERMDWNLRGLTGSEIYNLHADLKDEARLVKLLKSPLGLLPMVVASQQYPQEALGALQDYPADYLKRWDELCQSGPLTGIAANDAHHNIGVKGIVGPQRELIIEDNLGKKLLEIDPRKNFLVLPWVSQAKVGDVAFQFDLDPYERSFRHVTTHLLLQDLTEREVRTALESGRAFVAFEWLADAKGFRLQLQDQTATAEKSTLEMGSQVSFHEGLSLRASSPLPVRFRIVRNGKEIASQLGRSLDFTIKEPGVYRVECWLNLADTPMVWILSNPIYVR